MSAHYASQHFPWQFEIAKWEGLTIPLPVNSCAHSVVTQIPPLLQHGWRSPTADSAQRILNDLSSGRVEGWAGQIQGCCLEGCSENIRNWAEEYIPHQQAKERGPDPPFRMNTWTEDI